MVVGEEEEGTDKRWLLHYEMNDGCAIKLVTLE